VNDINLALAAVNAWTCPSSEPWPSGPAADTLRDAMNRARPLFPGRRSTRSAKAFAAEWLKAAVQTMSETDLTAEYGDGVLLASALATLTAALEEIDAAQATRRARGKSVDSTRSDALRSVVDALEAVERDHSRDGTARAGDALARRVA
jgi:hypothetical protein